MAFKCIDSKMTFCFPMQIVWKVLMLTFEVVTNDN